MSYLLFDLKDGGAHALAALLPGVKTREYHADLPGPAVRSQAVGFVLIESSK